MLSFVFFCIDFSHSMLYTVPRITFSNGWTRFPDADTAVNDLPRRNCYRWNAAFILTDG